MLVAAGDRRMIAHRVPVRRAKQKGMQNQPIQRALQQFDSIAIVLVDLLPCTAPNRVDERPWVWLVKAGADH